MEKRLAGKAEVRLTACHEAGHAVVAYLLGHTPSHLEIRGDERFSGSCHTLTFPPAPPRDDRSERSTRVIADLIRIALAGPVAESLEAGADPVEDESGDLDRALRLAFRLVEDCEGAVEYLNGARAEVEAMLRENRPLLHRLTEVLLEARVLSGETIAAILEAERVLTPA